MKKRASQSIVKTLDLIQSLVGSHGELLAKETLSDLNFSKSLWLCTESSVGQEWKQGDPLKAVVMQVRGKSSNGRTIEKWLDSGFNLKVEPTGFAQGFSVGC